MTGMGDGGSGERTNPPAPGIATPIGVTLVRENVARGSGGPFGGTTAPGLDEGPVLPPSWRYLEAQGIALEQGLLEPEAGAVMRC
jgi:hypothetical protein